jgi:hypothetical protein
MLGAWTIRREVEAGKTEDETDEFIFEKCAKHQSAVVHRSDENVSRDYIGFTTGPHCALKFFDESQVFGRLKQFNDRIRHTLA